MVLWVAAKLQLVREKKPRLGFQATKADTPTGWVYRPKPSMPWNHWLRLDPLKSWVSSLPFWKWFFAWVSHRLAEDLSGDTQDPRSAVNSSQLFQHRTRPVPCRGNTPWPSHFSRWSRQWHPNSRWLRDSFASLHPTHSPWARPGQEKPFSIFAGNESCFWIRHTRNLWALHGTTIPDCISWSPWGPWGQFAEILGSPGSTLVAQHMVADSGGEGQ